MTDSVLDRFTRGPTRMAELAAPSAEEVAPQEDYGSFGWLRGTRDRAIMLELRRKDGSIKALGYAWLQLAEFDPSGAIVLAFPAARIKLVGRNLNAEIRPNVRLFQGLIRQRVPYVQEADEVRLMQAGDHDPVIERIEW